MRVSALTDGIRHTASQRCAARGCPIRQSADVFLNVKNLRSGERYEQRLLQQIDSRDVFYLFWSQAARLSSWVEKEWRFALGRRGIDFIDPVPLADPSRVPPPRELAGRAALQRLGPGLPRGRREQPSLVAVLAQVGRR